MPLSDPQQLAEHLARVEGMLDGALTTLRFGLAVIGSLLAVLVAMVVYIFQKLSNHVDTLRSRSHRLINYYNRVAAKLDLPMYEDKED